jgi:hypothetical protein
MTKRYVLIDDTDADPRDLDFENGPVYIPDAAPIAVPAPASKPWFPMKDAVIWKHKTGNDGEDDIFSTLTIACDIVFQSRVVRTIKGDEIACDALLTCVEALVPGDVVTIEGKDWPIKGIARVGKDINRTVQWRTVGL